MDKPTFRISAAVVKQLGEELVSDELTAIMELVKNSYDADADWVKITINTTDPLTENSLIFENRKGYIIIEDNGVGMTYDDIKEKWLFISVSHKREMKAKGEITDKGRTPLGDKGLGRLSTQRLGHILEMFTCKESEATQHHVAFDWRHFTESNSLENVDTHYSEHSKSPTRKGTKLIITDLKDPDIWTGEAGDKFRGQLSKLIFPFKENRPFNIYLNINGQSNDLDEIGERLRQLAISRYKLIFDGNKFVLEGSFKFSKLQGNSNDKREMFNKLVQRDSGKNFFDFLTSDVTNKKYNVSDLDYIGKNGVFFSFKREFDFEKDVSTERILNASKTEMIKANPGVFLGEIDEFNLSGTEEIDEAFDKLSEYKQLVKNQIGVRIFRDGFGIKPYGMEDNDWLKLSKGQTSGGSFYLLRPENVIGFVSITAKDNKELTEKTDREGFLDTPYSRNFFKLINLGVAEINSVLERTRRSYDIFKAHDAENKGEIKSFDDTKQRLIKTAKEASSIEKEATRVFAEINSTAKKVTEQVSKIKNEPLFTSHEDNKALKILEEVERLLHDAESIFEKVSSILNTAKKLENDANYLEPKINELESQIIQFSELAGLGITAEAFTHEMYNIIDRIGIQTDKVFGQVKKSGNGDTTFFVYVEHVRSFLNSVRRQLNHLAPSLRFNRETKQEILLGDFIEDVREYYKSRSANEIELKMVLKDDFSVRINKGKLTQIIDNIVLNSEYWLRERQRTDSSFKPQVTITIERPFISISDNGYGVSPAIENGLFQPFVTTKPSGKGRGLGLFIVQQLLDSVDGNITLLSKRNEHDRRFIFQITLEPLT